MSNIKESIVETDAQAEEMYQDYLKGAKDSTFLKCGKLSLHVMNHRNGMVTLAVSTPETSVTHFMTVKDAKALAEALTQITGGQ